MEAIHVGILVEFSFIFFFFFQERETTVIVPIWKYFPLLLVNNYFFLHYYVSTFESSTLETFGNHEKKSDESFLQFAKRQQFATCAPVCAQLFNGLELIRVKVFVFTFDFTFSLLFSVVFRMCELRNNFPMI